MGKFIQVGTAAIRSPNGDFLPAEPVYRDSLDNSQEFEYISDDDLAFVFAEKCANYLKAKKAEEMIKK